MADKTDAAGEASRQLRARIHRLVAALAGRRLPDRVADKDGDSQELDRGPVTPAATAGPVESAGRDVARRGDDR